MHFHLSVLDDVRDLARAYVGHFYVIVPVVGKVGEACVAAQGNLLTLLHQSVMIDDKFLGEGRVEFFVDFLLPFDDAPFFVVDVGKTG